MIFNRSFIKGDDKLNPQELFVCAHLYRCRLQYSDKWMTSTNLILLNSMVKCKIDGVRNGKLDMLKNVLMTLTNKGYIYSNVNKNTTKEELLNITFPVVDSKQDGSKGSCNFLIIYLICLMIESNFTFIHI